MSFKYTWKHGEANFGRPLRSQITGGTHITFEIILKYKGKYVALRRASIPGHEAPLNARKDPKHHAGQLFFCHNLIRYGESVEKCVKRIVREQAGVGVKSMRAVYIDAGVQKKDGQWAIVPHVIAELATLPKVGKFGNEISEVVTFSKNKIPEDFAWWGKKDLQEFLKEFDQ